jgi:hypothetical protein
MTDPADRSWAAFTERAPWIIDRDHVRWLPLAERLRRAAQARHLRAAAQGGRGARAHLHQAGADHLLRRGDLPRGAGLGVQEVPGPGPPGAVRRGAPGHRGGALRRPVEEVFSHVRPLRRWRRRRSPRCTGRRCARARTWWSRSSARRWPPGAPGPAGHGLDRPVHLVGRIPISALANPPALVELFAETITEELDFRLEAQNMLDVAAASHELGQRGLRRPPAPPRAGDPPGAGDGAADGFNFDDVAGMHGRRHRHRGRDPHRHDRLHGGCARARHLPRRPPRREPLRACPTAAPRCSTSASSAASTGDRRLAFLRLMLGGTTNDVRRPRSRRCATWGRCRPTPTSTPSSADLRLDQPPVDPTTLTGRGDGGRSSGWSRRCSATAPACPRS